MRVILTMLARMLRRLLRHHRGHYLWVPYPRRLGVIEVLTRNRLPMRDALLTWDACFAAAVLPCIEPSNIYMDNDFRWICSVPHEKL